MTAPVAAQPAPDDGSWLARRATSQIADPKRAPVDARLHMRSTVRFESSGPVRMVFPARTITSESFGHIRFAEGEGTASIETSRTDSLAPGLPATVAGDFARLSAIHFIGVGEIVLLNARFPSPLAADATVFYRFDSIRAATLGDGRAAIAVSFSPRSSLHPGFSGRMIFSASDTVLSELEMEPSPSSALAFGTRLSIRQTWSERRGQVLPAELVLRGNATIRAAAFGIAEPHVSFEIMNVGDDDRPQPDATEAQASRAPDHRAMGFSAMPLIDYNRAGAATLGASVGVAFGPATISVSPAYSFGLDRMVGDAAARLAFRLSHTLDVALRGAAFSQISPTTIGDRTYPRIMNTLVAASLHQDYYDFFRKDGWSAGIDVMLPRIRLGLTYEQSRQFSIGNNARWSLLTQNRREFPQNPKIDDGRYRTIVGEIGYGEIVPFLTIRPIPGSELRWTVFGLAGSRVDSGTNFRSLEALVAYALPVAETGYNPMILTLLGAGGVGTSSLPPQYQFRLRTSAATFGKPGGLVSPRKGLYGGTRYAALGAELNTTDLPWRAMGLPTRNGRGVELILAGASARYDQQHDGGYRGTGGLWYSEAGIGLGRIPLFVTDIIYARVDARMGFGPLGTFGANLTLTGE